MTVPFVSDWGFSVWVHNTYTAVLSDPSNPNSPWVIQRTDASGKVVATIASGQGNAARWTGKAGAEYYADAWNNLSKVFPPQSNPHNFRNMNQTPPPPNPAEPMPNPTNSAPRMTQQEISVDMAAVVNDIYANGGAGRNPHHYGNGEGHLPAFDNAGNPITYTAYDVHPTLPGDRGNTRIVVGSDGNIYWTNSHYGQSPQSGVDPFYHVGWDPGLIR